MASSFLALILKNLSFSFDYHNTTSFFKDVSLSLTVNKLHFIRGKNGSGKSTLFRILNGKIYGDEYITGQLKIGTHREIQLSNPEDRFKLQKRIRMVPQEFDLMLADQFTFTQNLQLANMPHQPFIDPLPKHYLIPDLIHRFGINFHTPVHLLSGGQRQILAVLMALQKRTSILLLDEPTAALDDKNAEMVMLFLGELLTSNPDLTILIICHDKELVETYAPKSKHYYEIIVQDNYTRTIEKIARN